ncbi:MAG: hypothetical protein PHR28_10180 [candidate division Zixibacteria bacterium]|nr:hypothetical protein [candidate division Zixibacteria bacterium]
MATLWASAYGQTPPQGSSLPDQAPFKIEIERNRTVMPGQDAVIVIRLRSGSDRMTGFSFLLAFDTANMIFKQAEPGGFVKGRGWADFSVEPVTATPKDSIAPISLLRITAATGRGVPPDSLQRSSTGLVRLVFFVDKRRAIECRYLPVRFFWRVCEDNIVLDGPEKTPYYALEIHDRLSSWTEPADSATDCLAFAEKKPDVPASCRDGGVPASQQGVVYIDGGIEGYCDLYSSVLGDLDLNGLPDQETDVVALARLLVHGSLCGYQTDSLQFLLKCVPRSASDSVSLSISSLVSFNRTVAGDQKPVPPAAPDSIMLTAKISTDSLTLSYFSSTRLGTLLLTLATDSGATIPVTSGPAFGRQIAYARFEDHCCLIIYDIGRTCLPEGKNNLGGFPLSGLRRVISAKAADYYGRPVKVVLPDN